MSLIASLQRLKEENGEQVWESLLAYNLISDRNECTGWALCEKGRTVAERSLVNHYNKQLKSVLEGRDIQIRGH